MGITSPRIHYIVQTALGSKSKNALTGNRKLITPNCGWRFGVNVDLKVSNLQFQDHFRACTDKKNSKINFKENNLSVPALNVDFIQFSERASESVSRLSRDTETLISLSDLVCAHSICSLDSVSLSVSPSDTASEILSPIDHMFREQIISIICLKANFAGFLKCYHDQIFTLLNF